jgi:hypothetical protein
MLYFGYKIFTRQPVEPKKEFIEVEINCNLVKVSPETLALISVGDKDLDAMGNQRGEIVWMGESRPYVYKFFGDTLIIKDKALKEVPVKLKLKAEIKDDNLYYNGKQIINASPLVFQTYKYNLVAMPTIILIPQKQERWGWVQVRVKFQELLPELSNVIKKQDIERDNENKIVGVLKEIIDKKPSGFKFVEVREKKLIFLSDPSRSDVTVLLNLLCTDKNGILYFKDSPVKIGNPLTFTTDLYSVSGIILGLDLERRDVERNN